MSSTTTSNSDGDTLRACRDDIHQDESTKKIKEMADAINNLAFSKAADDPRAIRSTAIRDEIAFREFGEPFNRKDFTDGYLTNRDQAWNRAKEVGQRNLVRAQGRASGTRELPLSAI